MTDKTLIIELTGVPNLVSTNHYVMPDEKEAEHLDFYSRNFVAGFSERYAEAAGWRGFFVGLAIGATLIGYIVTASTAHAETIDGDRIRIVDGDTVALPCDPARGIYPGCAERVRLVGIDAPETGTRARCEAEAIAGLEAKAALAGLIRGRPVEITRTGVDRYGRTLARLTAAGRDVDAAMLAAGAAIPYAPGRAAWGLRCRHWCPSAPRCEE